MKKALEDVKVWFHQVPLGDGRVTPGRSPVHELAEVFLFNDVDFQDKSVLDIGAWDGYFSFTSEQRGARRVLALDDPAFRPGGLDGFNFLHDHFQSSVEWRRGSVYQLPEEMFDVVLCFGVLYHLSDPLLAATNCFQKSNDLVLIEGVMFEDQKPLLSLLNFPYVRDPSNVFNVSTGFLLMVARLNGFRLVKHLQRNPNRGAMLFQAQRKTLCPYVPTCFPFRPAKAILPEATVRLAFELLLDKTIDSAPSPQSAATIKSWRELGSISALGQAIRRLPEFQAQVVNSAESNPAPGDGLPLTAPDTLIPEETLRLVFELMLGRPIDSDPALDISGPLLSLQKLGRVDRLRKAILRSAEFKNKQGIRKSPNAAAVPPPTKES